VDRAAVRRDSYDVSQATAVLVREGEVATREGHLLRVPARDVVGPQLTVYVGWEESPAGGHDLVALVPADAPADAAAATPPATPAPASADAPAATPAPASAEDVTWTGLREFFALCARVGEAAAADREVAATAVALAAWHHSAPRCGVCGSATEVRKGGWVRWCEHCRKEHYPRTDPAVIVAITDPEDRLLIAHASYWAERRFSHLAGYVEPGESLEQAVHREVGEEAGLRVRDIRYVASQPWPFPASLMTGFTARVDDPTLTLDNDEITEAIFVTRAELAAMEADGSVLLPPVGSIARRLMEDWYGGPLGR